METLELKLMHIHTYIHTRTHTLPIKTDRPSDRPKTTQIQPTNQHQSEKQK